MKKTQSMATLLTVILSTVCHAMHGGGGADPLDLDLSNPSITKSQMIKILSSDALAGKKRVSFARRQDVDDDVLKVLSSNPHAAHLANFDLSGTRVTRSGLEDLLKSDAVGTRRDLPQYSERYSAPASELYFDTRDTGINKPVKEELSEQAFGRFKFNYGRYDFAAKKSVETGTTDAGIKRAIFR